MRRKEHFVAHFKIEKEMEMAMEIAFVVVVVAVFKLEFFSWQSCSPCAIIINQLAVGQTPSAATRATTTTTNPLRQIVENNIKRLQSCLLLLLCDDPLATSKRGQQMLRVAVGVAGCGHLTHFPSTQHGGVWAGGVPQCMTSAIISITSRATRSKLYTWELIKSGPGQM